MRIFLPRPLSNPLLYHLKRATIIKAPYFEITHIFETHPNKSIVGIRYTDNHVPSSLRLARFEATNYIENATQHTINNNDLQPFNYIVADNPHISHFMLPSYIKPNDRLLLI
jgi:hypothetical protein